MKTDIRSRVLGLFEIEIDLKQFTQQSQTLTSLVKLSIDPKLYIVCIK